VKIHASSSHPGSRAASHVGETMKMPEPIIDPTTTIVES